MQSGRVQRSIKIANAHFIFKPELDLKQIMFRQNLWRGLQEIFKAGNVTKFMSLQSQMMLLQL